MKNQELDGILGLLLDFHEYATDPRAAKKLSQIITDIFESNLSRALGYRVCVVGVALALDPDEDRFLLKPL